MAIGVPETDVFAAADAVLARGERPTVERVRLELGRGSPARVGALLDQWWDGLAQRLRGETRLPELPTEVAQAFVAVWQQAILRAQGVAEQSLSAQRAVLDAERERIATVEEGARQVEAQARQQQAAAEVAQRAVETRLADLDLLLAQRQAQLDDLQNRCAALTQERKESMQDASTLRQELLVAQRQLTQERESAAAYVRGVEERAHREVDHVRQESRATAAQLKAVGKQHDQLRQRLDTALTQLSVAQQLAAAEKARASTLEQQLAQSARAKRARATPVKRQRKPAASN